MSEIVEPARSGPGSGRAAWAAYADHLGVSYPTGAGRADIMAAVEARVVPPTSDRGDPHEALARVLDGRGEVLTNVEMVDGSLVATITPETEGTIVVEWPDPESVMQVAPRRVGTAAPELVVIIPSRGRPESVARAVAAWQETDAFAVGRMLWVLDQDDPTLPEYLAVMSPGTPAEVMVVVDDATGMVPKSNQAAREVATDPSVFAIGWAGDDHLPRTVGWAQRYLAELHDLGTGVVYGDDLHHGEEIPTQWAMTADIVRAIGRMIPALVRHLYSDNAVGELGKAAGCIRYLPDVTIEHLHPIKGKSAWDDQYRRMNSRERTTADRATFDRWRKRPADHPRAGLASQAAKVRALRGGQ